jgi:hypothetical protein
MAGFAKLLDYKQAIDDKGQVYYSSWRKSTSIATSQGVWYDLSMSAGNPAPQYYAAAPLVATQLKKSTDGGFNHGSNVSPSNKYLNKFLLLVNFASAAIDYVLCDYLLYYPFIDQGTNDAQVMDNTLTLTRYTDGKGVQMIPVSVAPHGSAGATYYVTYTNSDGVAGRISKTTTIPSITPNGTILNADTTGTLSCKNFIGLQDGDSGVRSIQSVTFPAITDVGLMAIALVKPLCSSMLLEQTAASEITPLSQTNMIPRIYDDAYLNCIFTPIGNVNGGAWLGEIETVFN